MAAERIYHQNLSNLHKISKQCLEEAEAEEEEETKRKMVARQAQRNDSQRMAPVLKVIWFYFT